MTPPKEPLVSARAEDGNLSAVSVCLDVITSRADFQRASRAPRIATPGFILQMRAHGPDERSGPRVGFTCSKKVGNAVARNRAKRRLREIARLGLHDVPDADYVFVGRKTTTAGLPFSRLQNDLDVALRKLGARGA